MCGVSKGPGVMPPAQKEQKPKAKDLVVDMIFYVQGLLLKTARQLQKRPEHGNAKLLQRRIAFVLAASIKYRYGPDMGLFDCHPARSMELTAHTLAGHL